MIIDTSILVAVVRSEDDADTYATAVARAESPRLSCANYHEAAVVIDARRRPAASRRLDALIDTLGVGLAPVTPEHAAIARQAYRDFGKGSGHPAALNFGDCFAYALAIESDEPLLFKGDDSNHTDVRVASAG